MAKNLLLVFSGPSGVGKGTILNKIAADLHVANSISCTTRAPRPGEKDGREYFFVTKEKFADMIKKDELLEYDEHFGNYYGTPKAFVEKQLLTGDVVLEIEVNGALNAKRAYPSAVLFMIVPPSEEELKNRLLSRGTESEESLKTRLQRLEYELSKRREYDYVIVNDDLERAVAEIKSIIAKLKETKHD